MDLDVIRSLVAEPGKSQAPEVFLLMMIPLIFGIALFGFGMSKEKDGGRPFVKYLAVVPVAIAAWMGYPYFDYAVNPFNKSMNAIGGRSEQMYWVAFWLPVAALIALIGLFVFEQVRAKGSSEDF